MSKLIFNKLKIITFHIIMISALFLSLIAAIDNKNTMIITMHTNPSYPLEAEFYYTTIGVPFDDNKMSRRYKIKDDKFYFDFPEPSEINYARLDPCKRKHHIFIYKDIQIILSHWFKTEIYTADVRKSEIGQQIDHYNIEKEGIRFNTTGRDPQLNINLTRTLQYTSTNYHLDTFLLTLLIYTILLFLYRLYKYEEHNHNLVTKLILYALFFAFALCLSFLKSEHT